MSFQFSSCIDPKWEFPRENITMCDVLCEGQFTILHLGVAKGIKDKLMDVAIKSVKGKSILLFVVFSKITFSACCYWLVTAQ